MWLLSLTLLNAQAQENIDTPSVEVPNGETETDTSKTETDDEQSNSDEQNVQETNTSHSEAPEECLNCNSDEDAIKSTPYVVPEISNETQDESKEIQALEAMIEEVFSDEGLSEEALEMAIEEALDEEDSNEGLESFNYKGNFYYSGQFHRWNSSRTLYSVGVGGDPQYWFSQGNWGPTLGLRFQLSGSETQQMLLSNNLLGITAGMQFGSFRINTAGSWMWERYFFQEETEKDSDFITYRYDELEQLSGIMWEQTLTYTPNDKDFGLQATIGFPFQMGGDRDVGEPFIDSFKASSILNIKTLHLGYTFTQYPDHYIHMTEFGFGLLL